MSGETSKLLYEIYLFILAISFSASIINRVNLPPYYWLFSLLLGLSIINESLAYYLLYYSHSKQKTYFLYHFFIPVYYSILACVYYNYFQGLIKKTVLYSIPVFIGFNIYLSIFVQKLDVVNTYSFMIMTVLVMGMTLYFFYELFVKNQFPNLWRVPFFWINTGNLFFYPGMFFMMSFMNVLIQDNPQLLNILYSVINRTLNYMLYSLFTIGFLCTIRKKK
jgi:hypothetical protein